MTDSAQHKGSEETTVISTHKTLKSQPEPDLRGYEETTVIMVEKTPEGQSKSGSRCYEETTTVVSPGKATETAATNGKQAVVVRGVPFERISSTGLGIFTATELENAFYQRVVKGGRKRDKYRFGELLETGGMGAIFTVVEQDLHRSLAMKIVLPALKNNKETLSNFVKEAKITGFLEHPNIIPIHELSLLPQTGIYFTMELAQGDTLKHILTEIKRGNPEYVEKYTPYLLLIIFRKVCDAIAFAHSMNIIHQDIKPHNIIVGHYGEVFLMDWGLAKILREPETESNPVKREFLEDIGHFMDESMYHIKGSPSFMAPEQAKGEFQQLDERSDIFLLGATLYHIFTLESPYFGSDIYDVLEKAKNRDLIPPEIRAPERQIPEEICRIIKKAMSYRKEDRYKGVKEFAKDIDDLIAGKWLQQEIKMFNDGDILMQEGEQGEEAYLILKGRVEVFTETSGQKVVFGICKEGDIIGEMALISNEPRSASVQALERTEAAVLTKEVLSQNLKKLPPYMEKIISTLTFRLQNLSARIHPYLTSDCTAVVLNQLRLIFKDRSDNQSQNVFLPVQELVEEISENLGIPEKNVRDVLARAGKLNLLVNKDDNMQIPDMKELKLYIRRAKMQNR